MCYQHHHQHNENASLFSTYQIMLLALVTLFHSRFQLLLYQFCGIHTNASLVLITDLTSLKHQSHLDLVQHFETGSVL